jgi:putative sigma-54 modulation protein
VAEATIWTKGPTLRAKEASHDVFASIDLVAEKLTRQVQKYREKRIEYKHGAGHHNANGNGRYKGALQEHGNGNGGGETVIGANGEYTSPNLETTMPEIDEVKIVKTKQFRLGPMTPEEAALQMDLVGHDFFVFVNNENNQTCVLYKRADGAYGLIEPTLTEVDA